MYNLYKQLKALVLGEAQEDENEEGAGKIAVAPAQQQHVGEPQKRFFTGEITYLSGTSGMIDEQVARAIVAACTKHVNDGPRNYSF